MATPGQPTLYKPEYCERAHSYCTTLYKGEERKVTNTVSYPPDTTACKFWLINRQPDFWWARAEAAPEPEIVDDMAARLDAAGESMRHAAE